MLVGIQTLVYMPFFLYKVFLQAHILNFSLSQLKKLFMLYCSFAQLPIEIYHISSTSNVILSVEDQINENRKTIREVLYMNPYEHKL